VKGSLCGCMVLLIIGCKIVIYASDFFVKRRDGLFGSRASEQERERGAAAGHRQPGCGSQSELKYSFIKFLIYVKQFEGPQRAQRA
jgi:hypothetical protein